MAGNSSRLDRERVDILYIYIYISIDSIFSNTTTTLLCCCCCQRGYIYSKRDERVIRACVTRCTLTASRWNCSCAHSRLSCRLFLYYYYICLSESFGCFDLMVDQLFSCLVRTHILSWHSAFYSEQMCRDIIISRALLLLLLLAIVIALILQEFRMKNPQGCALHVIYLHSNWHGWHLKWWFPSFLLFTSQHLICWLPFSV